jgi:hypothetical protein
MTSSVLVRTDDRLRLAGSLLAASAWPEREQNVKAYKPHRVAEQAHNHFASAGPHPAVAGALALAGGGEGLNTLYSRALNGDWPEDLAAHVADFKTAFQPELFWAETQADWEQAENDARSVLARADLAQFLTDLLGPQTHQAVFAPNLLYPGRQSVAARSAQEVVVCAPPPKAWGASPPWRYTERPDEVLATVSEAFVRCLFETDLPAEHETLRPRAGVFALGAAVLFLRQAEGDAAGDQFMVMEKRTRNLPHLPDVVAALEPLLADRRAGKYAGFADYAPQLRGLF